MAENCGCLEFVLEGCKYPAALEELTSLRAENERLIADNNDVRLGACILQQSHDKLEQRVRELSADLNSANRKMREAAAKKAWEVYLYIADELAGVGREETAIRMVDAIRAIPDETQEKEGQPAKEGSVVLILCAKCKDSATVPKGSEQEKGRLCNSCYTTTR